MRSKSRHLPQLTQIAVFAPLLMLLFVSVGSGHAQTSGCPALPTGAAGWWPAEGTAVDIIDTNPGSLVNGAGFAPGMVGHAFSFDGVNDYVNIPDAPNIFFANDRAFTIEAWFRPESETSSFLILKNAAYGIRWQGSAGPLAFYNGNYHYSTRTSWTLSQWYHVALVDDGATAVKLYVNGSLDKADDGVLRNPNRFPCHESGAYCFPLQFGGVYETHDVEYFRGLVDEVTLYDRPLSEAEIQAIFEAGSGGKCLSPDEDRDGYSPPDDCDDFDPAVFPGALEIYDAKDNNCNALIDEGLDEDVDGVPNFYDACNGTPAGLGVDPHGCPVCGVDPDDDHDGFPASVDCNDTEAGVNPGAAEICDQVDDDCDGLIDEGFDRDGDGYTSCAAPVADCNDSNPAIKPGASELPGNIIDENCDGSLGACDPGGTWKNHGEFVRCVTAECEQLVAAGVLTDAECNALVGQAGKSDVGK